MSIPDGCREEARAALQWLTFSARPVSIQEIAEAVALVPGCYPLDLGRLYTILDICSSLVSYSGSVLKLAHCSIKEHILSERGAVSRFHVSEISANRLMGEVCLKYLLSFNKPNSLPLQAPFLYYAAQYWYHHARVVPEDPQSDLEVLILNLLGENRSQSFLNWLRVCDPEAAQRNLHL